MHHRFICFNLTNCRLVWVATPLDNQDAFNDGLTGKRVKALVDFLVITNSIDNNIDRW